MNVVVITMDSPLYGTPLANKVFENSPKDINYSGIIVVPSIPQKFSNLNYVKHEINIFGYLQFFKFILTYFKTKIKNFFNNKIKSLNQIAKEKEIPIIRTNTLKSEYLLNKIRKLSPDVILTLSSFLILEKDILEIPKLCTVNLHTSMLPKYRGILPSFWCLLNQEKESAVTVHYMNVEIDAGDIIRQDFFNIEQMKSIQEMHEKILEIAPNTIVQSLIDIKNNTVHPVKNPKSESTYFSFPTKEDGKKFRRLGYKYS